MKQFFFFLFDYLNVIALSFSKPYFKYTFVFFGFGIWSSAAQGGIYNFERIKIGFNSHDSMHREILIGFFDGYATNDLDVGYDSINSENRPNDMYFLCKGQKLIIQGAGAFNINTKFPLGITSDANGLVSIILKEVLNAPTNREIFIYDSFKDEYINLKMNKFEFNLEKGIHDNRFFLAFTKAPKLDVGLNSIEKPIDLIFDKYNNEIILQINALQAQIFKVDFININGQLIKSFQYFPISDTTITLPFNRLQQGIYIIKVSTNKGNFSYKVLI